MCCSFKSDSFLYIKHVSMAFLSCVCIAMFDEWTGMLSQLKRPKERKHPNNYKQEGRYTKPEERGQAGHRIELELEIGFIFYWVSCSCVLRRLNWCEYRPGVEASRPPPWAPRPRQTANLSCSSSLKAGPAAGCVAIEPGLLSPDHGANSGWSWPAVKEASGEGRAGQGCCCSCDPALDLDSQPPSPFGRDLWVLLGLGLRNHKQSDNWWLTVLCKIKLIILMAKKRPLLQSSELHYSFWNHSNVQIWCSRNIWIIINFFF